MVQVDTTIDHSNNEKWVGGRSPFNVAYGKIMIWFFLVSDAFTFGAFLISLGTKRFFSDFWPDPDYVFNSSPLTGDANLPLLFVSIMTFILILSSVTMVLAVHSGRRNDHKGVVRWLLLTILGGATFLSCQVWEWVHLHEAGAWWGSFTNPDVVTKESLRAFFNPTDFEAMTLAQGMEAATSFFNYFFTITGFHGLHVTVGMILLITAFVNTNNGTYARRGHYEMVEKVGLYWHFVDLVWVFVFTFYYLV
ncbi:MAG TPA: cytochrome c oxidase subunit 3 [Chitinophagaceae bacterium]|nr:cytochrome c oxidase subunit 3 [Chitinophagaceae bacterium]